MIRTKPDSDRAGQPRLGQRQGRQTRIEPSTGARLSDSDARLGMGRGERRRSVPPLLPLVLRVNPLALPLLLRTSSAASLPRPILPCRSYHCHTHRSDRVAAPGRAFHGGEEGCGAGPTPQARKWIQAQRGETESRAVQPRGARRRQATSVTGDAESAGIGGPGLPARALRLQPGTTQMALITRLGKPLDRARVRHSGRQKAAGMSVAGRTPSPAGAPQPRL